MVRGLSAEAWVEAADKDSLAQLLSASIAQQLREAIDKDGEASLVVSGGSTPLPVFRCLSAEPLDWSKVSVTLADERWVPYDSKDSNERFVHENLLVGEARQAQFVSLYRDAMQPEQALADIEERLKAMAQPFTVVILGMGDDGHTASLFPQTDGLKEALDLDNPNTVAVLRPSTVPQTRISLTRRALANSLHRYLHITGDNKFAVLEWALAKPVSDVAVTGMVDKGYKPEEELPIASFFVQPMPAVTVYWSP